MRAGRAVACAALLLAGALALSGLAGCGSGTAPEPDSRLRGLITDGGGVPVEGAGIGLSYVHPYVSAAATQKAAWLRFMLTAAQQVRASVRQPCSGDTVAVLIEGFLDAGEHRISWDGFDDQGRRVNAGVYWLDVHGEVEDLRHVFYIGGPGYSVEPDAASYRPLAVTDRRGRFEILRDCLAFGFEMTYANEEGEPAGTYTIPPLAILNVVHDDYLLAVSDTIAVDAEHGAGVVIRLESRP